MKSPADLRTVLRRYWGSAARREVLLLDAESSWPLVVTIGRPSAGRLHSDIDAVKRHVQTWRQVKIGEVVWESVAYRAAAEPVAIPVAWKLRKPSEWVAACGDQAIHHEFDALAVLVEQTDPVFHPLLVRRRSLWRDKPLDEVVQAARLAIALSPGAAGGRPLRMLSIEAIDTKFFERHAHLVTSLLDARFEGEVSAMGLEVFLDAQAERDHWLLLVDLDGSLLPFEKLRVRGAELRSTPPPGERLLIVENERCWRLLPPVPGTVAVLGAGLDLGWTHGDWLRSRRVAYWGDIDTWGLHLLAKARQAVAELDALMMTAEVYDQRHASAVPEPVPAIDVSLEGLTPAERALYQRLLSEPRGRLEQEFLPERLVHEAIYEWAGA